MSKTAPTLATSSASTSITTRKNNIMSFKYLLAASILLRIVLLLYGEWQDANMTVKYTDIDYVVFTDAARFIVQGQSPYERATYRYTPLLAILLTPNILWFYSFGKCLFALADIGVGYIIHQILILRGMPSQRALWFDALWLLNPMVANISTRGNAESLLGIMVLGTLYFILTRKFYLSCFMFGLAVHFKIYPVIYAVTLLFLLDNDRYGDPVQSWPSIIYSYQQLRLSFLNFTLPHLATKLGITINSNTSSMNNNNSKDINKKNDWKYWFIEILQQTILFFSPTRIMFGLCSGSVFFSLTWFMYQLYGNEFLHETYLYHVTRQDHRHNFSLWFYQMYLGLEHRWMGLLAFIPQLLLVTVTGIVFAKDIFFACFIQTFLFVTFNKVCTSQYFMWYICLFPLVLPSTDISFRWKGASLVLAWIISQALWLQSAYQLEFMGENTFISLWISSILFFTSNCWIVVSFILNHQYERVYGKNGRIRSIYFIRP